MDDRYGYIGIETLLKFCENSKDHAVTPNDFMRMQRVTLKERTEKHTETHECDYISRQAAIDALNENKEMINVALDSLTLDYNTRISQEQRRGQINEDIETIKALSPARRKGKWIYPTDIKGYGRCPHCKALWDYSLISNPFFKFCPRCGNGENEFAELKGEEDERIKNS